MAEYIDRNLCEIVAEYDQYYKLVVPLEKIRKMPAADVVEVRHGRWIDNTFCSCCGGFDEDNEGNIIQSFHNYCPACGARMDKEDET